MEQKDYKSEIVEELLHEESHARAIAKKLNINHMIAVRKLKELLVENVVDFKENGKNKTFYLKKTIEAKICIFNAEHYKLVKLLKQYPVLRSIFEKIQKNKEIKLALLFGSYAKGLAEKSSDIDIFIETNNRNLKKELESINTKLNVKIGKFVLLSILAKEIIKNHAVIKGIEEFYERINFFE